MPKILSTMFALAMTFALVVTAGGMASAAVMPPPAPLSTTGVPSILRVANGCGRGFFRTIAGACVPNQRIETRRGVIAPPPCPRGYLRDPDPARPLCYPIY